MGLYFWMNENSEPVHVHVNEGSPSMNSTKLWLTKAGGCIEANNNSHIPESKLNKIKEKLPPFMKKAFDNVKPGLDVTQYGWMDVSGLGAICCLFDIKEKGGNILYDEVKKDFLERSGDKFEAYAASGYGTALKEDQYVWGGILTVMSNAMTMIFNYMLTGNEEMKLAAQNQLNYALGLNALDLSFVTGYGERSVMNPHHRPSGADEIEAPVPGLISGGPNKKMTYPETKERLGEDTPPAKYYLDELPSADTKEIAI